MIRNKVVALIILIVLYASNLCILTGSLINFGLLHMSTKMEHQLAFIERLGSKFFYLFATILNYPEPGLAGVLELATLMIGSVVLGLSIVFIVWKLSREVNSE